jgi:hypothetical protein
MHTQGLLEALDDLTPRAAERWVAAALAEAAALREHDEQLFPIALDGVASDVGRRLRDAWQRWADDADKLLDRMRTTRLLADSSPAVVQLDYEVGRARAMLSMDPQVIQNRRAQADRGDTKSPDDVRRELGLANRR